MTKDQLSQLGKTLWAIADDLRGAMNADDFRDYMLSFLFLRYLSGNYETAARKELGGDYPRLETEDRRIPLAVWYEQNPDDTDEFEKQMRRKTHYVIQPHYLWGSIAEMARTQQDALLHTLEAGFKYIENESFASTFGGLFSEINLNSEKLGRHYADRNAKLCNIITAIADGLAEFSTDSDTLGDAYEYLMGLYAADAGKSGGEYFTPQEVSNLLARLTVVGKTSVNKVYDPACGSGSLLLQFAKVLGKNNVRMGFYGQELNRTTYNLARINMFLHDINYSNWSN